MTFDQFVLPVIMVLLAAVGGVLADRAARFRRRGEGGDCGDFWARVVQRICVLLGFLLLVSEAAAIVPSYWQTGRHLLFDVTGVFGWPLDRCYRLALLLPFVLWGLLLAVGLMQKPGGRDAGRWLAGAIGFGRSRLWVLVWTLPLALVLVTTLSDLGGGAGAYPGAAWGTFAVLLLSLVGVALSSGEPVATLVSKKPNVLASETPLRPWPEALRAHGVQVRTLATWPASEPTQSARRMIGGDLHERLRLRGARAVAPELIKAVDGLLGATSEEDGRSRLIFAPDDCGEIEVVALAAELLDQRFHATTLVVTATAAKELAAALARWLPGRRVSAVDSKGEIDPDALIVVADAQILSDHLLSQLKNPQLVQRFGLIVWWHLEAYTGVLAANLWAISRRLHRLLEAMGRHDLRTLAFVRRSPHGDAQLAAFVRHLLPHPLDVKSEVHVNAGLPREVQLHVLESHEKYFERAEGRDVEQRNRHLPLVAAKVSVEERWATRLEVPSDISQSESEAFLQPVRDAVAGELLTADNATAAARVREVRPDEILSLFEIIGHGGRAAADGLPHHVAVTTPWNPYVGYLLSTLTGKDGKGGFSTSRRLVSTEAQSSLVRRHLLLALDELPDTMTGLLKNFLWNERVIRRTLEEIANEGKLTRREVRFLDERRQLRPEYEYKSQRMPTGERRPLDTVGSRLIEVRDLSGGFEKGAGVLMLVDPERLTIQAYPNRRFLYGGQRYNIREWGSVESAVREGRVTCTRDGIYSLTWRIRNANVFSIERDGAPVGFGRKGKLVTRFTASVQYEEDVAGVLRLVPNLTDAGMKSECNRLASPIGQTFATRALILAFPGEESLIALLSLAQALRHMLPVHLGVEEDALEVVPLTGELIQNRPTFGLAIVDLYPGGIGLVDAIDDDNPLLLQLLEWARDWLAACPCQCDQGCAKCLRSPAALAANADQPPMRSAALSLLRQVV